MQFWNILKVQKEDTGLFKNTQNPLIIESRKFDIRQWVLIENWNPLTVWIYDESYIRFAL